MSKEDLSTLGRSWGPKKATAFYDLMTAARNGTSKTSAPRIAARSFVSTDFVRSLERVTRHVRSGKYSDHESKTVRRVLATLGTTEHEFLERVKQL